MPGFWKQLRRSIEVSSTGVDSSLRESGIRGTAVINTVEETNSYVGSSGNEQAIFEMSLHVSVPGREPYDVVHRQIGNALVGTSVTVFVDPDNPHNLFIDWEASSDAIRLKEVQHQFEGTSMPAPTAPPPPAGSRPRAYFDWQLQQGLITQEQYDVIVPNLPDS